MIDPSTWSRQQSRLEEDEREAVTETTEFVIQIRDRDRADEWRPWRLWSSVFRPYEMGRTEEATIEYLTNLMPEPVDRTVQFERTQYRIVRREVQIGEWHDRIRR